MAARRGSLAAHAVRTAEQKAAWGHKGGTRTHQMHPETYRQRGHELARSHGTTILRALSSEQRSVNARLAHQTRTERQHRDGLTEKELAHVRKISREGGAVAGALASVAKSTPAERSERARRREAAKPLAVRMAATRAANRASVERVRRDGPTPKHLAHCRAIALKGNLAMQAKYRVIREGKEVTNA